MKEIIKKSNLFSMTAKPLVYSNEEKYRFFSFVIKLKVNDNYLLFNTLTRQLILLTDEEYLSIELRAQRFWISARMKVQINLWRK